MYKVTLAKNEHTYNIPDNSFDLFITMHSDILAGAKIEHLPDCKTKEERRQELYSKAFSGATMTKDEETEMKRLYYEEEFLAGLDGD